MEELKHFSHNHNLVFHHVPPHGSQFQCSGCKSPAAGNVFACWQCNYFLHEHCFRATRSLKHPSHPLHPLTLMPSPTYQSASFFCNSCNLAGDGFSYSCSECEFDIHVHCAIMPNPNPHASLNSQPQIPIYPPQSYPPQPQTTHNPFPSLSTPAYPPIQNPHYQQEKSILPKHFSHEHALKPTEIKKELGEVCSGCEADLSGTAYTCTESDCTFYLHKSCFDCPREIHHKFHPHPLTLLPKPTYYIFTCDGCQKSGYNFVYNCADCSYDLHVGCSRLNEKVTRPDHKHPLSLSTPVSDSFECDVCKEYVDSKAWVYYCSECDFGTHLECVHDEQKKEEKEEEKNESSGSGEETMSIPDRMFQMQQQHQLNMFKMQMSQQNAQFMNSLANSWKSFY